MPDTPSPGEEESAWADPTRASERESAADHEKRAKKEARASTASRAHDDPDGVRSA